MGAEGCSIDLQAQQVAFGGRVVSFDIDPEIKHRLLNGLDDIAITLADAQEIDAYEHTHARPSPATSTI